MVRCLLSACLLGLPCRHDGRPATSPLRPEARDIEWVPACPEQLGGLPTPREPAQIVGGDGADVLDGRARVLTPSGRDLTQAYLDGARRTLAICRELGLQEAVLKARSPSCGSRQIYRGEEVAPGEGVTAALLRRHGIRVKDDEEMAGFGGP